jgi:hypothetical protein
MAEFHIWNWIVVLAVLLLPILIVIPFWRLLPRAGIPGPVALLAIIPFVPLILLWILAFKRWPQDR